MQGVTQGPMGRTTVSLPGGFEPDSNVMVVVPMENRSRVPTRTEFEQTMLSERGNFQEGIIQEDRVDAIRQLEVKTNREIYDNDYTRYTPPDDRVEALVVELRTSIAPTESRFIDERMRQEMNSTFYIDTFSRII